MPTPDRRSEWFGPSGARGTLVCVQRVALVRRWPVVSVACVALLVAGCGGSTIIPGRAEKTITRFVYQHTGFRPTNVRCPANVAAKVSVTFRCSFTGPDGPYTVYMRITQVHGQRVLFDVRSARTG
jgi:hypothetical protein